MQSEFVPSDPWCLGYYAVNTHVRLMQSGFVSFAPLRPANISLLDRPALNDASAGVGFVAIPMTERASARFGSRSFAWPRPADELRGATPRTRPIVGDQVVVCFEHSDVFAKLIGTDCAIGTE